MWTRLWRQKLGLDRHTDAGREGAGPGAGDIHQSVREADLCPVDDAVAGRLDEREDIVAARIESQTLERPLPPSSASWSGARGEGTEKGGSPPSVDPSATTRSKARPRPRESRRLGRSREQTVAKGDAAGPRAGFAGGCTSGRGGVRESGDGREERKGRVAVGQQSSRASVDEGEDADGSRGGGELGEGGRGRPSREGLGPTVGISWPLCPPSAGRTLAGNRACQCCPRARLSGNA